MFTFVHVVWDYVFGEVWRLKKNNIFFYLLKIYLSIPKYQTLEFVSVMHISNKG